ncbi:MAG TPA: DUF2795 domain-containing protein [Nitrososphaera sp.]|nr:DUF2795 domain-containing protein [Nitrososphaera sp.]
MTDRSKESIDAAKHVPTYDAEHINRAVEKANSDPDFVDYAAGQLAGLQFPAFKQGIIDYAKSINAGKDVIALFESLNGYMEFRDQYHVHKALQENAASRKKEFQMSDETRQNLDVRSRPTTADASIKDREAVNESEERKDYPEVTPTAMSNFVCDTCGKQFQNQDDLAHHRQFESGTAVT